MTSPQLPPGDRIARRDSAKRRVRAVTAGVGVVAAALAGFLAVVLPAGAADTPSTSSSATTGDQGGSSDWAPTQAPGAAQGGSHTRSGAS
jgi:hypothetical protein